jgi:hypothetical protein
MISKSAVRQTVVFSNVYTILMSKTYLCHFLLVRWQPDATRVSVGQMDRKDLIVLEKVQLGRLSDQTALQSRIFGAIFK